MGLKWDGLEYGIDWDVLYGYGCGIDWDVQLLTSIWQGLKLTLAGKLETLDSEDL